jgi:DNA-directed RNA polymerase subunit RPC12/RpoP
MLNIIKRGNIPMRKIKCDHCQSVLEFSSSEESSVCSEDGLFGVSDLYYIKCPVCGDRIITRIFSYRGMYDYTIKE